MADPTATPATPQKSPLDVLEEILGNAPGETGAQPDPAAQAAATAAAEEAEKQRLAAEIARQREADQQALQTKLGELANISQTPAYQARVQQDEQKKQEAAQKQADNDGYEIHQLTKMKI
jgi:hypothetical protein